MIPSIHRSSLFLLFFLSFLFLKGKKEDSFETLPLSVGGKVPLTHSDMWGGFDPRKEPLDVEVLHQWEEGEVVLQVLHYRIGVFKGKRAMMAGIYGYPKGAKGIPGLLQIHGGGQYADRNAPLTNAKRGYATLSIAWAGRISAPSYRVSPAEVKLFWEAKTSDPRYKLTTDWGALDAYHAPSRYGKDAFPSIPVEEWTLDPVKSPRNNAWFLVTLAARRGLTFLERQPEVDGARLGVYGHSMGGKLTVATAGSDSRVKAAVPSCGGMSDRYTDDPLHLATVSDPPNLKNISCPIMFLSPANDFHGRINDLPAAIEEIKTDRWRVTCAPHHNHQDTAAYEVGTQIWFDQYLKGGRQVPAGPKIDVKLAKGKSPEVTIVVDDSRKISSIDVFYTQQGQVDGKKDNSANTKNRFWHHSPVGENQGKWVAKLPVHSVDLPLWVYANVSYELTSPIRGAGYYYGTYEAKTFTLSSLPALIKPDQLRNAKVSTSLDSRLMIEDFQGEWQKEWFTYKPGQWGIKTHKVYDPVWKAPQGAKLGLEVQADQPNQMILGLDGYATELEIRGGGTWTSILLRCEVFKNAEGQALDSWQGLKELQLDAKITLNPGRGSQAKPLKLGADWKGTAPAFRNLRWVTN